MMDSLASTQGKRAVLAVAAALFAGIIALKLAVRTPGFGIPLLYDIPVALLAIAFGVRAGLAGAAVGMVLYAIGDAAAETHANVWGYGSRALTFVLLGVLLGLYSDRLRRAEARTRDSEGRLNRSQRIAGLGSWEWDIQADVVTWSDELHRLYGTSPDGFEASYAAFLEMVHPDDREELEQVIGRAYSDGEPFELDHRIVRRDGAVLTLHASGEVTKDEQGNPLTMAGTGQDVTALLAVDEAVRRLAAIVDQSEDSIVAKDTEGVITEWNHGAERLFGYPAEEAVGKSIAMIIPPERAGEDRTVLSRILEGRPLERYETVRQRKDGSRVDVWLTISPLRDLEGTIVGASSIARDINEVKRTQHELERSNRELEQFAYVASHDLQEPLRSIAGFADVLARRYEGKLDAEADQFIGFILTSVERMQALIDDLLSYSRAGRTELQRGPVDTRELVESTLVALDAAVREAGAEITLGELPTVNADTQVLLQVFQNLLSNALKFTADRRPRVEVSAEHTNGAWTFAVEDNGIGIDPAQADRVFRMFQRLHGREEYGGTGIGLAISKRVVERLGGRIWCEPGPQEGTVFRFTIPDSGERT